MVYHAIAEQEGPHWVVKIQGLPDGFVGVTQGRTWREARSMAADVVAILLEVPEESIEVVLTPADPDMADAIIRAEKTREEAEAAAMTRCPSAAPRG